MPDNREGEGVEMEKEKKEDSFMMKLSTLIVDKRKGFYLIFILLILYSVFSMNKVKVNNDLTSYLPDTTETRQGLDLMEEQFVTYGTARVMVCNVTFQEAEGLAEEIREMDGVSMLDFEDAPEYYHDCEALLKITFDGTAEDEGSLENLNAVLDALSGYDVYYSSDIGQEERDAGDLNNDMIVILLLAGVVIVAVLLFTSTTYAEIPVFLMTFIVAAILNKGTNYWFGTISFVTDSIAVVLQLELAGICFGVSAFMRKGAAGVGLGIAAIMYFLNLAANIAESAGLLKYITPFGFSEGADIAAKGRLDGKLVFIGMVMGVTGIAAAYVKYGRKDIH